MNTVPRIRTCCACRQKFQPARPMQRACSPLCAVADIERKKAKAQAADKKLTRAKLASLKSRATLIREAQMAVNRYVRCRDAVLGCISCDKPASWDGQWHASHMRSAGAASAVRFNLWNINKSCSICNNWKSGNLLEYEPRLIEKIGASKVAWIRTQNQRVEYSREYLQRLKKVFSRKAVRCEQRNRC